jgi:membrane protease YdiL (CAAX protease family)
MQNYNDKTTIQTIADVFIIIGLAILGMIVGSYVGMFIGIVGFDIPFSNYQATIVNPQTANEVMALKLYNFFSNLGAWVLSVWVYFKIRFYSFGKQINFNSAQPKIIYAHLIPLFFALTITSAWLLQINQQIALPEWIEKLSSKQNKHLLTKMLQMNTPTDYLINLFFVALTPAILEEIFFRGTLQKLFIEGFKNTHIGIFVTSFIFAGIHLNVQQFIPMLFLALVFGYICHYSKSIWPSIILHFFNNGLAVTAYYLKGGNDIANELVNDNFSPSIPFFLLCFFSIVVYFIYLHKQYTSLKHE